MAPASSALAKPIWRFSVVARMPQSLVTKYGLAAYEKVQQQLATISSRFNDPDVFSGTFSFDLAGFEISTGSAHQEVKKPHPGYDFAVVYDETVDGGWYGQYQAILHAWQDVPCGAPEVSGGVFGALATDGLVHEFGHARGAIDVYEECVDPARNPINGAPFYAPGGIMNFPYNVHLWDQYSAEVINASAATIYREAPIVDAALPPLFTIAAIAAGAPLAGAHIDLFPVIWRTGAVSQLGVFLGNRLDSHPVLSGITTGSGEWTLPHNPFAAAHNKTWNIAHPNFLVRARVATGVHAAHPEIGYEWLSLSAVGAAAFAAPYQPYRLEIGLR